MKIRKLSDEELKKELERSTYDSIFHIILGVAGVILSVFWGRFGFLGLANCLFAFWHYNNIREVKIILEIRHQGGKP